MLLSFERPIVGALAVDQPGATLLLFMVWSKQSCRSRFGTCANGQLRFPRNLGVLSSPRQRPGWSHRVTNSRPRRCTRPSRSELTSATEVPPNEGNEVRRDGRQEKNRKGVPDVGTWTGNHVQGFVLGRRVTITIQDSNPGLQHFAVRRTQHWTNRMR